MEQDRQGSLEIKQTGSKLTDSNNVTDADKEEPRADEEAAHDNVGQQTYLDAQAHYVNEPRPDEEAVHDGIIQQAHLGAQASYANEPRPDEEAAYDGISQQTHLNSQASYVNRPHADEESAHDSVDQQTHLDAQAHYVNEPRPDEEAVHDIASQHTDLDSQTHYNNEPHRDTEAGHAKKPSLHLEAQCNNETKPGIHEFKEPRLDEEAGFDHNKAHYDRGWAWVILVTTFLMEFFVGGLITSSGVIYAALIDEFNKSRVATGNRYIFFRELAIETR